MSTLTNEHQIAYQTVIEVIKQKKEKKRKLDQRFWFIFVFVVLSIAFLLIGKDWFNVNYWAYLSGIAVGSIILLWILPLGKAREMTPVEIRYSISEEMKKQVDDLNFIERQRAIKVAKLEINKGLSHTAEATREIWEELGPILDETIDNFKNWGKKLDMAFEYYEQHQNAVNT